MSVQNPKQQIYFSIVPSSGQQIFQLPAPLFRGLFIVIDERKKVIAILEQFLEELSLVAIFCGGCK